MGTDDLGDEALRELEAEGIDVAAALRLDDVATGVAVIVVDEHGENQIAVASGANAALTGEAVTAALTPLLTGRGPAASPARRPGLGVSSCSVTRCRPRRSRRAPRRARAAGWQTILNPAPARDLIDGLDGVILTPNADEARRLSGESDLVRRGGVCSEREPVRRCW